MQTALKRRKERKKRSALPVRLGMLLRLLTLANFAQFFGYLNKYGVRSCLGRYLFLLSMALGFPRRDRYRLWVRQNTPDQGELESLRARSAALPYKPVFSLLVPVSRTDGPFLGRCIQSIADQAYPFWELCIVGLNSPEGSIEKTLQPFKAIESRVKVLYGDRTDFCPGMESAVTGDFICIVHEDAVLAPEALGECALFLNNHPDADALYSDEDRIDARNNRFQPFFKPDWSPEYLESFPYISLYPATRQAS